MHAISDGKGERPISIHPVPHSLSVHQILDPEAALPTRPTARSLPNAQDVGGANILEGLPHVPLRLSDASGLSDLPRRSSPRIENALSIQVKTNFQHSNDTSPFSTPLLFDHTAPPAFPGCIQSAPVRTLETDAGESESLNAEEQLQFLECATAAASEANVPETAPANSSASDVLNSEISDSMLFELESSVYRTEPSANESYTASFVTIGGRAIHPHAHLASVEEDDDLEDEIGKDSPYWTKTSPKDIPIRRPSRHVRDSGNVPDADMPNSIGQLSALLQASPLSMTRSSRSSSVFANNNSSYPNENRCHFHEVSLPSADERRRHMTESTSANQLTTCESRELLNYLPESPRRRRSDTVPPAYPIQMPPTIAHGLGVAVLCPSSPKFNQLWARHPNAQSYSVPPTPTHDPNESELGGVFLGATLSGVSGDADGSRSVSPFGHPQSAQSSAIKEAANDLRLQDQLQKEVSSECNLASSMISVADSMDSSSSSTLPLPRYFSFNVKHTGSSNPTLSLLPQARKQRRGSVFLPIDNNLLKKKDA